MTRLALARSHAASFVAQIDADELAVRLMEIAVGLKRAGDPRTPAQILDEAERDWAKNIGEPAPFRRMALAAISYLGECVQKGKQPS